MTMAMTGDHDEVERDLADVRAQIARVAEFFSPATMAGLDALRASTHEQLERTMRVNPQDSAVECTWLTAGGAVGQLLASPETFKVLSAIDDDETRGGVAALLLWAAGISPLPAETVTP
ncbi:MAG: hypothetical protein LC808_00520 [Actinobacteria bacterium]|nr:hypothetical protein [Actinomycetota bacterium]